MTEQRAEDSSILLSDESFHAVVVDLALPNQYMCHPQVNALWALPAARHSESEWDMIEEKITKNLEWKDIKKEK